MFIKSLTGIANAFASTLPKPRKPTLHPKLCQRACKAYGCSVDTLIPIYELNGGVQSGIKEGMVLYSQKKKEIDVIVNQIDEDKAIACRRRRYFLWKYDNQNRHNLIHKKRAKWEKIGK